MAVPASLPDAGTLLGASACSHSQSGREKDMGMVATPILATQQMPLHWTSHCMGTEDRVGEIGDPLSSEGTTQGHAVGGRVCHGWGQ